MENDTMATTKMTNKTALEIALGMIMESTHPDKDAVAEKLTKQIASLEKKSAKTSGEPTKAQKANMALADQIAEWMEPNKAYSIAEISKNCPAVLGATPQKIRPLLTLLIADKVVERSEEKGKPMFTKVVED
jgi:hypothetical protein